MPAIGLVCQFHNESLKNEYKSDLYHKNDSTEDVITHFVNQKSLQISETLFFISSILMLPKVSSVHSVKSLIQDGKCLTTYQKNQRFKLEVINIKMLAFITTLFTYETSSIDGFRFLNEGVLVKQVQLPMMQHID